MTSYGPIAMKKRITRERERENVTMNTMRWIENGCVRCIINQADNVLQSASMKGDTMG